MAGMNTTAHLPLVLKNAAIFDGVDYDANPCHSILIEHGRIARVVAGHIEDRPDVRSIDVGGRTVMPGMIDAHFHCNSPSLNISSIERMRGSLLAQYARKYLEETLLRGFTTVREAGGADIGLVRATQSGLINGPRLLIAGKALSQTGGHGDFRSGDDVEPCGCGHHSELTEIVDGVDSVRRAVRNQLRQGAHQIKIFVSGGVLSPTDPIWMDQFTEEEIAAAVEEAARWRTYVMAHAHTARAARRCVAAGVRSIEHGTLIDRETADYIAEKQAFVVPTLCVIQAILDNPLGLEERNIAKMREVADHAHRAVEHCIAAGVRLGLGTDLFGPLHGLESRELLMRSKVGGALATLRSATSVNAELIGQQGQLGIVKANAIADLLVIDGNPLENLELLLDAAKNVKLLVREGVVIKNGLEAERSSYGQ